MKRKGSLRNKNERYVESRESNLLPLLLRSLCYSHSAITHITGHKFKFTQWLPIKVMKAIIGDQTNKIIEINLIWPTYGGFNARRTLLLLSNMRQIAQTEFHFILSHRWLHSIGPLDDNENNLRRAICSHPFQFLIHCDDQKVNSSLLLFHYPSPHFKKYVSRWRVGNIKIICKRWTRSESVQILNVFI